MSALSIFILLVSISYLALRYPKMLKSFLPGWLTATEQKDAAYEDRPAHSAAAQDQEQDSVSADQDGDSTPKAEPVETHENVPTFTLSDGSPEQKASESSPTEPTAPMFPAANSAQRASASMLPPPKPSQANPAGLMAPPGRIMPGQRQAAAASPRIPSNGPLPNRGPPAGSQQRVNSSLSPNGLASTPNARGKVLLSPGHSPMDWAALTRRGNLGGVDTFQRVTPSQLRKMTGRKGKPAWSSWQGKVYNITPYLPFHPGGEPELMKAAGRDGTKLFMDVHPWVNWENMLSSCLVGVLVPEDYGAGAGSLEDMD
jgi:cytochrome b involved in lipid metabolism